MALRQKPLFEELSSSSNPQPSAAETSCRIEPIGKRRDGGTKYWCKEHHADATAKYGRPAAYCRYAHVLKPSEGETFHLDPNDYPGGIALWGAVPPVYDTTALPLDRGIHLHARHDANGPKLVDQTYRRVVLQHAATGSIEIAELDAIYFMVSSVFGFKVKYVECTRCGHPHLDRDWFSVHEHGKHLCAACGKNFRDSQVSVGNPLAALVGELCS